MTSSNYIFSIIVLTVCNRFLCLCFQIFGTPSLYSIRRQIGKLATRRAQTVLLGLLVSHVCVPLHVSRRVQCVVEWFILEAVFFSLAYPTGGLCAILQVQMNMILQWKSVQMLTYICLVFSSEYRETLLWLCLQYCTFREHGAEVCFAF